MVGSPCDEEYPGELEDPHCAKSVAEAGVYSPSDGDWKMVAAPPPELAAPRWGRPPEIHSLGWTGEVAVFQFNGNDSVRRYATYDPGEDRWRELPAIDGGPRDICVAGGAILAIGLPGGTIGNPGGYLVDARPGPIRTARYEPNRQRWVALPDQALAGPDPSATTLLRCEGGEAIITRWPPLGQANPLQWFDPSTRTWPTMASPPEAYRDATPTRIGTTRVLYTTESQYWLLDDGAAKWQGVPKPPTGEDDYVRSNGEQLVISGVEELDVTLLRPEDYAAAVPLRPVS